MGKQEEEKEGQVLSESPSSLGSPQPHKEASPLCAVCSECASLALARRLSLAEKGEALVTERQAAWAAGPAHAEPAASQRSSLKEKSGAAP